MDWLLTVPLLLIEIILVMKLPADEMASQAKTLGAASALMIVLGYPGELMLSNLGTRWLFWACTHRHSFGSCAFLAELAVESQSLSF
jgi:bacteriorhodopsin